MKRKKKAIVIKPLSQLEALKSVRKSLPSHLNQNRVVPDKKTVYKRKPKHPHND